jgi:chemotaxis protein MotB
VTTPMAPPIVRPKGRVRSPRDRWLIAYADMVTLLLTCFVSLYAATLTSAPAKPVPAATSPLVVPARTTDPRAELRASLQQVADAHGGTAVELSEDTRGLVISLPEAGSFPTGRAEPTPAAEAILLEIGRTLAAESGSIRVEGHTDDVPMRSGEFQSNWDLSAARATRVVQLLIGRAGVTPARLSAAGYGEFRPRVANDSPDARARNRRVDIVVLNPETTHAEEPGGAGR